MGGRERGQVLSLLEMMARGRSAGEGGGEMYVCKEEICDRYFCGFLERV